MLYRASSITSFALGLALLGGLLTACESSPTAPLRPDGGESSGIDAGGEPSSVTTYYGEVRPLLAASCLGCHTTGGIAPFPIETYEQAREVAERMAEVTADRIMPPFLADNSGDCQTWKNFRGLTQAEIDTFEAWVNDGTPAGEETEPPPQPTQLPTLDSVGLTLEMANEYNIDESVEDDYRCFVVEPEITGTVYLTGYDVIPGNPQRDHHVIVYSPTTNRAGNQAREQDTGDGYPCYGGAGVSALPVVLWAPGTGATEFPRGTGIQLPEGRPLIVQVHYNNQVEDAPSTDRTRVDLQTTDSAIPAQLAVFGDFDLNLAPRMEAVTETATVNVPSLPVPEVRIYGVFPHMHELGQQLRVEVDHGNGEPNECLIDVPRWDFGWQLAYWLDEPMTITEATSAVISCTFNTMERDSVTNFGEGTEDEMCLSFVYVSL